MPVAFFYYFLMLEALWNFSLFLLRSLQLRLKLIESDQVISMGVSHLESKNTTVFWQDCWCIWTPIPRNFTGKCWTFQISMRLTAFESFSEYIWNVLQSSKLSLKRKMLPRPHHPTSNLLILDHLGMSWPNKLHGCVASTRFSARNDDSMLYSLAQALQ